MMLRVLAAVLSVTVAAALAVIVLVLPDPAPTLAPAAAENAAATGLGNPVTNVLMAFRAMDTMLEKIVLLLALIGVWSLAPDRLWGGRPGPRHHADPQGVLGARPGFLEIERTRASVQGGLDAFAVRLVDDTVAFPDEMHARDRSRDGARPQ